MPACPSPARNLRTVAQKQPAGQQLRSKHPITQAAPRRESIESGDRGAPTPPGFRQASHRNAEIRVADDSTDPPLWHAAVLTQTDHRELTLAAVVDPLCA